MDKHTQENIQEFVSKNPSGVIVIYGPTGCGKTALSLEVAELIGSEIISVDARQVYRGLDIGTGKITELEKRGIPHHMLDVVDITEPFSVVDFRKRVEELEIWKKMKRGLFCQKDNNNLLGLGGGNLSKNSSTINNKGGEFSSGDGNNNADEQSEGGASFSSPNSFDTFATKSMENSAGTKDARFPTREIEDDRNTGLHPSSTTGQTQASQGPEQSESQKYFPILCGGTGLYIDSLIYERDYMGEKPDFTRRDELEAYRLKHGNQTLWNMLYAIDPVYADMLHVNNYTYIIRGIEVFEKTGKSKLEATHGQKLLYPTLFITPYADSPENRAILYERINIRVNKMFDDGLVEEVGYNVDNLFGEDITTASSCPGLVTIGYREVIQYLQGQLSLPDCISLVQQHNRNYAKRQITWNKKYDNNRTI